MHRIIGFSLLMASASSSLVDYTGGYSPRTELFASNETASAIHSDVTIRERFLVLREWQMRICAANAAVLATRRCPEELLPTLCHHGNLLGNFLRGASRGSGLLRAACLQVTRANYPHQRSRCRDSFGLLGVTCTM